MIAVTAAVGWGFTLHAGLQGVELVAPGLALLAVVWGSGWLLLRGEPVANALADWNEFRSVRSCTLRTDAAGACELILELASDAAPRQLVTLHCRGVGGVRLARFQAESWWVGTLFAEPLPADRRDGMRFHVHGGDGRGDGMVECLCRSFEVTRGTV